MSARDFLLPDSRMAQTLAEIGENIQFLERRLSWSSTSRVVTGGPWAAFGTDNVERTLLSLDLDPGCWVLFANVSLVFSSNSTTFRYGGLVRSRLRYTGTLESTLQESFVTVPWQARPVGLTNAMVVSSMQPEQATFSALGGYAVANPAGTWTPESATLIAFPG